MSLLPSILLLMSVHLGFLFFDMSLPSWDTSIF